jgi:pimeloyl-ACP methyl ester carboxylesterase
MSSEHPEDSCAAGATVRDEMVHVTPQVSLRVITFTPSHASSYPDIVFVAGWISLIQGWKNVLREMTKDFVVRYVETREKISSRIEGNAEFGVEEIGSDLVLLVERMGLSKYVLFGSSLGATAIIDCYRSLRRKPVGLVLVAPNAVFRVPRSWKIIVTFFYTPLYALIRPSVKWYLRTFRLNIQADAAQYEKYCEALDAADPRKLKKAVMSVWSYEVWDRLAAIDCPVLMVNASRDKLHEPENLRRIAAGIPNAVEVDLGTNSQTHDKPVVDAVKSFLEFPTTNKQTIVR